MIGVLIVSHAGLGQALIDCVTHVLNARPPQLKALAFMPGDDPRDMQPTAERAVAEVDSGEGVMVLADMYGGSPANLVLRVLEPGRVVGVAGVNLPMLMRVLTYREQVPIEELLNRAITGACDGVVRMKPL